MNNGTYQITYPNGQKNIVEVEANRTNLGSVSSLQDCLFEEVVIVPKREMQRLLESLKREEFECCAGYLENHHSFVKLESLANL